RPTPAARPRAPRRSPSRSAASASPASPAIRAARSAPRARAVRRASPRARRSAALAAPLPPRGRGHAFSFPGARSWAARPAQLVLLLETYQPLLELDVADGAAAVLEHAGEAKRLARGQHALGGEANHHHFGGTD